ncbi:MAG: hypothetical protein K2N80_10405 [Lachnospiraceae bacterium]|nr:hypothetical protein [Lachnospiraceae bacterium]
MASADRIAERFCLGIDGLAGYRGAILSGVLMGQPDIQGDSVGGIEG